jgi:nicotinamide riboside transporter PnuC
MSQQLRVLYAWAAAHHEKAKRSERGVSTVEWILITIALVAIAAVVIAAVTAFINNRVEELGN